MRPFFPRKFQSLLSVIIAMIIMVVIVVLFSSWRRSVIVPAHGLVICFVIVLPLVPIIMVVPVLRKERN